MRSRCNTGQSASRRGLKHLRSLVSRPIAYVMVSSVAGCGYLPSLFDSSDNSEPPAELVEFEATRTLSQVWRANVGGGAGRRYLKLRPAVFGARVFAAEVDGEVSAYELETGQQLWEQDTDREISGGPGTGEGLVLVGTSDGEVVALEEETGEQRWIARVSSEVLSPPVANRGVVVVRTQDGKLVGLATEDGSRLWVYDRTVPALSLRGTSTPALSSDTVVAGFDSGRLVALSLRTGQLLWESRVAVASGRSELERLVDIDSDPVIRDSEVFVVTYQGQVASVDLTSGDVLWRREMSSYAGLDARGGALYLSDDESRVWALDSNTSASIWRQDKLVRRALTQPAAVDDAVLVGDFEGYLHALHSDDGRMLARIRVDGDGIAAAPQVVDDLIVVYGRGGTLSVLRLE